MKNREGIVREVELIYVWLDSKINERLSTADCSACGRCCDFKKFDHRLFVAGPEVIYFTKKQPIKPMPAGVCPYRYNSLCGVHKHRFAGCRIFQCIADPAVQAELTESVLQKLKDLCRRFNIPYRYTDLASALNTVSEPQDRKKPA